MKQKPEIDEGPIAYKQFEDAMKLIVSVPKSAVDRAERPKPKRRKK